MSKRRVRHGEDVRHWHPTGESVRALAGVGEQFLVPVCPNGSEACARPDGLCCWECFVEGGGGE